MSIQPEPSTECVVCMDTEVNITFINCKHTCICFKCYMKLIDDKYNIKCPMCRQMNDCVSYNKFNDRMNEANKLANVLYDDEKECENDLFLFVKSYIRKLSPSRDTHDIIKNICEYYNDVCADKQNDIGVKINISHIQEILKIAHDRGLIQTKNGYKLQHLFVAMSISPWSVPLSLASSGICYYGNMGDIPNPIQNINLHKSNHKSVLLNRL